MIMTPMTHLMGCVEHARVFDKETGWLFLVILLFNRGILYHHLLQRHVIVHGNVFKCSNRLRMRKYDI